MQYEEWLSYGKDPNDMSFVGSLPPEHIFVVEHWPFAFEFFRHSMHSQVEQTLGLNPWGRAISSNLVQLHSHDPGGFAALLAVLDPAAQRFFNQRNNAYRLLRNSGWQLDPVEKFRTALLAYSTYYEAELPIWLLGVIGKASRSGKIDPTAFGGPRSSTSQGSLIDSVRLSLGDNHLGRFLDLCYDPDIRNAILHNDYEIESAPDGTFLASEPSTGRSWTEGAVWEKLLATQHMLQSVLVGVQLAREVLSPTSGDDLPDCGTVSVAYALPESGPPHLTIFQLWCFWELDPKGVWLDRATLQLESLSNGRDQVRITERAYSEGEPLRGTPWGKRLEEQRCVTVKRIPVCPALGRSLPAFASPAGTRYEVFGPGDDHLIAGMPV